MAYVDIRSDAKTSINFLLAGFDTNYASVNVPL